MSVDPSAPLRRPWLSRPRPDDAKATPAATDPARRALLASAAAMPFSPLARAAGLARVALVIGNAAYPTAPLLNPGRDAAAVAARLRALGFQVIERRDATRAQMAGSLDEAVAALRGRQGVGLLYYAGHGLQIDWRNYMLPVDAAIASAADVPRQALDVQQVLEAFRGAATRTNIVVLDACRDNPFGAAASARGLAPLDAPPGTFLAYATAPGNVADDGDPADGNGLYTRYLLQALERPESPIEDLFKRVRGQVRRASGGRQIPWESTSLEEDFAFATGARIEAQSLGQRDAVFQAQRRDWERIRESTRIEDFYAFLQQHPSGVFAELAQAAVDRLARPAVVAQAAPALAGAVPLPAGVDRYRVGDRWEIERIDHLAGDRRTSLVREVTSVEGVSVFVNRGQLILDQLGSLTYNRASRLDPGILIAPSDLRVGMRWRSDFYNLPDDPGMVAGKNFLDMRVLSVEALDLPIGRVRTWHVVGEGQVVLPSTVKRLRIQLWIDVETMWSVKDSYQRLPQSGRTPEVHETDTVVSRSRVPR
jgi:uncharacterized caspase-like protein